MVRNVLKDGLALEQKTGLNPFQMGFIVSTDTHSATPGGAEENNYSGQSIMLSAPRIAMVFLWEVNTTKAAAPLTATRFPEPCSPKS